MHCIKKVCIFGGTHGNELSGVYLVKKWQRNPESIIRPSFETKTLLSNPKAIEANRRYIDVDLNRSFTPQNFSAKVTENTKYEVKRAQEMKAMLSDGGEIGCCDMILDLHNTTANTKLCLITENLDDFTMQMLSYVASQFPKGKCHCLSFGNSIAYYCSRRLGRNGIGVEVGPQPQGVLRADIYNLQEAAVKHLLDFMEKFNNGDDFQENDIDVYEALIPVPFPRDGEGNLNGHIHADLQDKDWTPLTVDSPVFQLFDGKELYLKDVVESDKAADGAIYPVFVNEAAYYEKKIAFYLSKKKNVHVPGINIGSKAD